MKLHIYSIAVRLRVQNIHWKTVDILHIYQRQYFYFTVESFDTWDQCSMDSKNVIGSGYPDLKL